MNYKALIIGILFSSAILAPAAAHHSFAVYDRTKTLTLKGTVTEFQPCSGTAPPPLILAAIAPLPEDVPELLGKVANLISQLVPAEQAAEAEPAVPEQPKPTPVSPPLVHA